MVVPFFVSLCVAFEAPSYTPICSGWPTNSSRAACAGLARQTLGGSVGRRGCLALDAKVLTPKFGQLGTHISGSQHLEAVPAASLRGRPGNTGNSQNACEEPALGPETTHVNTNRFSRRTPRAASRFAKRLLSGLAAVAVAVGISFSAAVPSHAGVDGMTNNWSNWWTAHAEIWVYNHSMGYQSRARLGDNWSIGARSNVYSRAHVEGYSWTHNAFQVRVW